MARCKPVLFVALSHLAVTRATVPAKHCSPKPGMLTVDLRNYPQLQVGKAFEI